MPRIKTSDKPQRVQPRPRLEAGESKADGVPAEPSVESSESSGRRRLLNAAAIEFAEHGFEGASVLDIARRAGVKQPLLNYHFGGKEGLWRAVIDDGYRETVQVEERLAMAGTVDDPLQQLKQLLLSFAVINSKRPSVHAIMQKEMMFSSPRLDWLVDKYMHPFNMRLSALVEECMKHGIFKRYPTEHVCVMMTGALVSYFLAGELPDRMYGGKLKGPEAARSYFENSIDLLFNGLLVRRRAIKASATTDAFAG
jgi:TetR/AcrR family transcriptional regulator